MKVLIRIVCFSILFGIYLGAENRYMLFPTDPEELKCPDKMMFRFCLNNCSNCEQRGICPKFECKQKGCDCLPQFVHIIPDGPCEPISKCPKKKCGENEVFRECGPVCEHCRSQECRAVNCDYKCYCKENYKRDNKGKCIPKDECPIRTRCPPNERLMDSGLEDEFCKHSESEEVSEATINKTQCYCNEGMKKNSLGHCFNETYCEYVRCLQNEEFQICPRKCNTTCRNFMDSDCVEDNQCYPSCFCKEGFLMNDIRRCVKLEECPPGSNPFAPTAAPELEVTIPASVSSSDDPKDHTRTTPTTDISPSGTIIEDKSETSSDEEFPKNRNEKGAGEEEMTDDLRDEDINISTTSDAKRMPTRRSRTNKNQPQPRVQKTEERATAKSPSKAKLPEIPDEDDFDNE